MSRKRTSYEPGHAPKFLVVVDETPECDRAILFAARRAVRVGGKLVLLAVMSTEDLEGQSLFGVASVMRAEAEAAARAKLDGAADRVMKLLGAEPELVVREGVLAEAIVALIDEDPDIAILVLAAGVSKQGPGPLVTAMARAAGSFPVPLAVVPGHLDDEEIAALA